jgi:voltage-gated potassium channel
LVTQVRGAPTTTSAAAGSERLSRALDRIRLMSSAPDRPARRHLVITVIAQSVVAVGVLLALYYAVPTSTSLAVRVAGLIVFIGVVWFELRGVMTDPQPVARAVVAMARVLPLFIVLFAWLYMAMSAGDPRAFSEPLTKSGSLYFTVTVLSTVGFGDITPVTDPARLAVSVQMICDLVVIGIVVKLIVGVAKSARAQRAGAGGDEQDVTGPA